MEKTYTEKTYIIVRNTTGIVHPLVAEVGTTVSSGQPIIEEYPTKLEWETRLSELNFNMALLEGSQIL